MTTDSSRAVFLSYASQDAEAARRNCDTLRASGVEVWFDADGGLASCDPWFGCKYFTTNVLRILHWRAFYAQWGGWNCCSICEICNTHVERRM
jgi:hypothetical protein